MPLVDVEPSDASIERWCGKLGLPASRLQRDYAFYKDAQEKLLQGKQMLMEMAAAGKIIILIGMILSVIHPRPCPHVCRV